MATNYTPKQFSIQRVFELTLRDPDSFKVYAHLDTLKTSGLENTMEMVYPTGGAGNVYIGGGFAHSKRARLNVENAIWNTEVMAIQNGTQVVTANTSGNVGFNITEYEEINVSVAQGASASTGKTSFAATGTAGSEIGFAYAVGDDGSYTALYEQKGTSPSATQFTYDPTTKTITFGGTTVTGKIAVCYQRAADDGAQMISVNSDAIPDVVLVTAVGECRDICTGVLYPCQIDGMAQIDGNNNFDLSADGDPSSHTLGLEFVKSCTSKRLYDFKVYNYAEEATAE